MPSRPLIQVKNNYFLANFRYHSTIRKYFLNSLILTDVNLSKIRVLLAMSVAKSHPRKIVLICASGISLSRNDELALRKKLYIKWYLIESLV